MVDTETLTDVKCEMSNEISDTTVKDSDFPSMGVDLIKQVNIKIAFFLLMIGLFIFSDIFIERFLPATYQDGTGTPNTSGTTAQLIILILCYIVIDLLSQGGVL